MLETFVGPCPAGMQARHLDGDRSNNRLSNLAWGTPQENSDDTRRHGRVARGFRLPQTKLSPEQVAEVAAAPGLQREIAARFGISRSRVGQIKALRDVSPEAS